MEAELCPDRCQGGEDLRAGEGIRAVGLRRGLSVTTEEHEIVARFADAECKDLAGYRAFENEAQIVDPAIGKRLRDTRPHQVHIDRERRSRCRGGQALLQQRDLGEAEARPSDLRRGEQREVSGIRQICQVIMREGVVAIVLCGALTEPLEQRIGQYGCRVEGGRRRHASASHSCRIVSSGASRCGECPAPSTTDIVIEGRVRSCSTMSPRKSA